MIARGRLRRAARKARRSSRARRTSTWCSARRRCTACPSCSRAGAPPASRRSTSASRDREVRPPAAGARRRRRPPSSRSWKAAASTAASASCPTRAARKCRARSTTCVAEIAALAEQGVKEVTLLGQNVNAWRGDDRWRDRRFRRAAVFRRARSPASSASATPPRIRASSRQRLIDAHASSPKLAPHLHLPVQSGTDRVLAAMKRGYTALEYRSIVRRLRQAQPGPQPHLGLHRRLPRRDRGATSRRR